MNNKLIFKLSANITILNFKSLSVPITKQKFILKKLPTKNNKIDSAGKNFFVQ